MLTKQAKTNIASLDAEIAKVLEELTKTTLTTEEYDSMSASLEQLYKIKAETAKNTVGLRDWIPAIGSVGAVVLIVAVELAGHSVTSKAVGFVTKVR